MAAIILAPDHGLPPFPDEHNCRHISGWPGYAMGSDGSSWSCRLKGPTTGIGVAWRELKQMKDGSGYLRITLQIKNKSRTARVNVLMLETFVGPRPQGKWALHRDGIKTHNSLHNLYWGTPSDNLIDRFLHGHSGEGERNHNARLCEEEVKSIRELRSKGRALGELAKIFRVNRGTIYAIVHNDNWVHLLSDVQTASPRARGRNSRLRASNR